MIAASERDRKAVDDDQGIENKQPEPPTKPNSSASVVKMKSVCFSGRKLKMALAALQEALAEQSAGAEGDL